VTGDRREERLSRQPRVTLAWRLPNVPPDHGRALGLGAQLLTFLTDGAWGMRLQTSFAELGPEAIFRVDLVLPYDEPVDVALRDAEGFLRMLTLREMSTDFAIAAHLALDRGALFALDSLPGRAELLGRVEQVYGGTETVGRWCTGHWTLERDSVRDTARVYLRQPRVVVHARPINPRPAKAPREEE